MFRISQQPCKSIGPQLNPADIIIARAIHQFRVAPRPVCAGPDKLIAEVEQADQLPVSHPAAQGQHPGISAVLHPHVRLRVKAGFRPADGLQPPQALEQSALVGIRVLPPIRQVPLEGPPVDIPAVVPLVRIVVIGIVIEPAHLIPAVDDRDATLGQHPGVEGQVTGNGPFPLEGVPLAFRRFQSAEGGGGAAEPGVAQTGVVVIQLSSRVAAGEFPGKPVVQIALVGYLVGAGVLRQPGIVQSPADIIVTAQVVEEQKVPGQGTDRLHLPLQQGDVPGGRVCQVVAMVVTL